MPTEEARTLVLKTFATYKEADEYTGVAGEVCMCLAEERASSAAHDSVGDGVSLPSLRIHDGKMKGGYVVDPAIMSLRYDMSTNRIGKGITRLSGYVHRMTAGDGETTLGIGIPGDLFSTSAASGRDFGLYLNGIPFESAYVPTYVRLSIWTPNGGSYSEYTPGKAPSHLHYGTAPVSLADAGVAIASEVEGDGEPIGDAVNVKDVIIDFPKPEESKED